MSTVNEMFGRRARASEGSFARDEAKAAMRRLRDRLIAEGKLPAPPPKAEVVTVDVLAEISAHHVPLGHDLGQEPTRSVVHVAPADPKLGIPALPSQSQVAAEIYSQHMGKKTWLTSLTKAIEPRMDASPPFALARRAADRPLSRRDVLKLESQAKAAAGAMSSVLVGTFACFCGAALAGVTLWRWYGRPDGPALERKLQQSQAARARAIDDGLIGQSVRTIASSAEQGIKEHEGLHKMAEGLKEGRVFRVEPRAEQAGSAHVR